MIQRDKTETCNALQRDASRKYNVFTICLLYDGFCI